MTRLHSCHLTFTYSFRQNSQSNLILIGVVEDLNLHLVSRQNLRSHKNYETFVLVFLQKSVLWIMVVVII